MKLNQIIWGVILLTLPLSLYSKKSDSLSVNWREYSGELDKNINTIVDLYFNQSTAFQEKNCNIINQLKLNSKNDSILYLLLNGDCSLLGALPSDSLAYQYYFKAYSLSKKIKNDTIHANVLRDLIQYSLYSQNNLSHCYSYILEHKSVAYDKLELLQNKYFEYRFNSEMNYLNSNHDETPISNWNKLANNCAQNGFDKLESEVRSSFAVVLEGKNEFTKAKQQYLLAIEKSKKFDSSFYNSVAFSSYANMGDLEKKLGQHEKSITYFKKALTANYKGENSKNKARIYKWISNVFFETQDIDSAFHYLNLNNVETQKANEKKHKEAIYKIQSKHDNERLNKEVAQEKTKRLRNLIWAIALAGLAGLLAVFYYLQSLRRRNLQNELENTKLKAAYDATRAKMEGEQQERQEIASVLHDQVASLLTAADMHLKVATSKNNPQALDKTKDILKDVNVQVRNLSHQLVSPALMKFGLEPALESLVEKLESTSFTLSFHSEFGLKRIDQVKETFIYNACAELVQNAMKHSKGNEASISLVETNNNIILTVTDNGENHELDQEQFGLGLTHIANRAEALGGSFELNKNHDSTKAELTVPV